MIIYKEKGEVVIASIYNASSGRTGRMQYASFFMHTSIVLDTGSHVYSLVDSMNRFCPANLHFLKFNLSPEVKTHYHFLMRISLIRCR